MTTGRDPLLGLRSLRT